MSRWRQYHIDGPNQGFIPVQTTPAVQPKWQIEIGFVGYGSPVIGVDGTVYIGTLNGELVAVNPNGTIKWRRALPSGSMFYSCAITGSPAVGNDGNIYVISTVNANIRDHRDGDVKFSHVRKSSLHSVDPAGNIRWSYEFPANVSPSGLGGYTTSSPKIFGEQNIHIVVPAIFQTAGVAIELLVIDQGGNLVYRTDIASYPPSPITADGPSLGDILNAIWDFISSPVDFDTSGVGSSLEDRFGWPEPTIAVVDFGDYTTQPIIIIDDNYKTLAAFRWQGVILTPLWIKTSSNARLRSSPAVFTNSLLAIGDRDGTMNFFDVESGEELWKPWYKAKNPIMAPAASFGRQVYFIADKELIVLDSNSKLWRQNSLASKCLGAPAISADFVYVSANDGLYTFTFDLQNSSKNGDVAGGVSSPSIADDGTIYVMDLRKTLWAFGGQTNILKGVKKNTLGTPLSKEIKN